MSWARQTLTYSPIAELKKKRTFRKFSYRGIDLDQYVRILIALFPQPQLHRQILLQTPRLPGLDP